MAQRGRKATPPRTIERGGRLAEEVRSERDAQRLSREALARRVGISTETLRRIETAATHDPGFFTVVDLADALGLSLSRLADRTGRRPTRGDHR
jgi:transcriptional regulator with XRE-family HTH domain